MAIVNPYLNFNGNTEEAFDFYRSVFGHDYCNIIRYKDLQDGMPDPCGDKESIMHISLPVSKETILMGSDRPSSLGPVQNGNNFFISIQGESEAETKRIFRALSEGGTIVTPLERAFWGAIFGMLTDKFGVQWMINYQQHLLDRKSVV